MTRTPTTWCPDRQGGGVWAGRAASSRRPRSGGDELVHPAVRVSGGERGGEVVDGLPQQYVKQVLLLTASTDAQRKAATADNYVVGAGRSDGDALALDLVHDEVGE